MIAKAIKTEHPRPRPLHLTVEHFFKGYPGLSMLVPKLGGVPAHPANVHRLLYDEEQLVLVFPEGAQGHREALQGPLPAAPLRPRRLRRVGDARAGADRPGRRGRRRGGDAGLRPAQRRCSKLTGLIYFPITPTFPWLGLLGGVGYLPAKFFIRFLEPIPTDQWGDEPWNDTGLVQTVAEDVRARIQEELYEMLAERTLGLARMKPRPDHRRSPATGAAGSPRSSRRDASVEAIIGVATDDPTLRAGAHRVRPRRHRSTRCCGGSCTRREIDTVVDTRLIVDSTTALAARRARAERDRDDEHPRRLRRAGLAGAQGRLQVLARTTTAASATTRASSPRRCSARTRRARGWSPTSSRPTTPCAASPSATRT